MEEPRRLGDRYELGPVLGRGGMAEVHMARDTRLGRTVAVKMLRVDLARDPSFQARFRREAQSTASLNHPSIVAVYDSGEDVINGLSLPYIVMEYVDGSTLRELLQSGRRLLPERALEITAGVLQALGYSHRNGIVHRDIKPGNVMLTRSGAVKVMDFGIARAVADTSATMTQTAAVIGTAQYLSPEQARGETVDARSDLYSTGCLLYELLTGRPPFIGDSPVSVAYQHVREEPQPPSHHDPELGPGIDQIVLTALAKSREERYQTADDIRADIERVIDGRPVAASGIVPEQTQRVASTASTNMFEPATGEQEDQGGRKAGYALLALAAVAIFLGAAFLGRSLLTGNEAESRKIGIPSVIGEPQANAQTILAGKGFTNVVVRSQANETQQPGRVFDQQPVPRTLATKDTQVTIVIALAPPDSAESENASSQNQNENAQQRVPVPNLVGLTAGQAQGALRGRGLEADVRQANDNSEPGRVFRSDPGPGIPVPPGSTVVVFVARDGGGGDQNQGGQTAVPRAVGSPVDTARQLIQAAGLVPVVREQDNDSPPGVVFQQNPAPGTAVQRGSTVTILVAREDGGDDDGGGGGDTGGGGGNNPPPPDPSQQPPPPPARQE